MIAYVRVVDGVLSTRGPLLIMSTKRRVEPLEVGIFGPDMVAIDELGTGQVGYVATGFKDVRDCAVGDTITLAGSPASEPLPGFRPPKPMVFAGLYPVENEDYADLRDALEKLQLNDASLVFQPESSVALSLGFRCGFLGLLHMEIVQERLEREYGLELLATAPSVEFQVLRTDGDVITVDSPAALPPETEIEEIHEPWMRISLYSPKEYIGALMDLATTRRGEFDHMEYLDERRVVLHYTIPLSEDPGGFSRSAQVPLARLCLHGLCHGQLSARRSDQDGCAGQRRAGGCAVAHRAPRQGVRKGQRAGAPAQGGDSAAALPRGYPGGSGQQGCWRAPTSARCARTSSPSAMAATLVVSANCWSGKRWAAAASSGSARSISPKRRLWPCCDSKSEWPDGDSHPSTASLSEADLFCVRLVNQSPRRE